MSKKNGMNVSNFKLFLACHILFLFIPWLNNCHASCTTKELHLKDNKEASFEGKPGTQVSITTIGISINNPKNIVRTHQQLEATNSFLFKIIAVCNPSKDAMNMFPYHFPAEGPTLICPKDNGIIVKFLVLNSKHTNRYTYHAKVVFNEHPIDKGSNLTASLSLPQKFSLFSASMWKRIKSSSGFLYLADKIKNLKKVSILSDLSISNISHLLYHTNVKHITTCEQNDSSLNKIKLENRK